MIFDSLSAWVVRQSSVVQGLYSLVKGSREEIEVERHRFGGLVIYEVTSDQIENLKRETLTISEDLTFATIGITTGAAFLITLLTADIKSDRLFNSFFIICALGFIVAAYWGFRWIRGRRSFQSTIARIERSVGPLGEEGRELSAADLPGIPSEGPK